MDNKRPVEKSTVKKLVLQFIKFGIVGFLAFVIDYGLFMLLTYVFGLNYLISAATSYIVSTVFNFTCSMRFVFEGRSGQTRLQQFVIFFILSLIGLGINQLLLFACVDIIHMGAWLGKLVATVLVMLFNFVTRKYFFEDRKKPEDNLK